MSSNLQNKSNKSKLSDKFGSIYDLTPNRMHLIFVYFNPQNSQSINLIIFLIMKI
jgi:hypothetical protein